LTVSIWERIGYPLKPIVRFPPSPLKSRTVRFPQSGFKLRISYAAFPVSVCCVPCLRRHSSTLLRGVTSPSKQSPKSLCNPRPQQPRGPSLLPLVIMGIIATMASCAGPCSQNATSVGKTHSTSGTDRAWAFPALHVNLCDRAVALTPEFSPSASVQPCLEISPSPRADRLGKLTLHLNHVRVVRVTVLQQFLNVTARSLASPPAWPQLALARALSPELTCRRLPNLHVGSATMLSDSCIGRSSYDWIDTVTGYT